jgi:hypothetical protein
MERLRSKVKLVVEGDRGFLKGLSFGSERKDEAPWVYSGDRVETSACAQRWAAYAQAAEPGCAHCLSFISHSDHKLSPPLVLGIKVNMDPHYM